MSSVRVTYSTSASSDEESEAGSSSSELVSVGVSASALKGLGIDVASEDTSGTDAGNEIADEDDWGEWGAIDVDCNFCEKGTKEAKKGRSPQRQTNNLEEENVPVEVYSESSDEEDDDDENENANECIASPEKIGCHNTPMVLKESRDIVGLAADTETLSTLVALVKQAGLVDTLKGGPFTVLAPTNAAFAKLPEALTAALVREENKSTLRRILLYHVVPGIVLSGQLPKNGQVQTASEDSLRVKVDEDGVLFNNAASVAVADIRARNGVVHVIDQVLVPPMLDLSDFLPGSSQAPIGACARPKKSTVELVSSDPNLSTLLALVKMAGLVETLRDNTFTVFAPTNAAFAKLPPGLSDELQKPENKDQLKQVLLHHVVSGKVPSTALPADGTFTTASGETVTVRVRGSTVTLNGTAVVTRPDLGTTTGIVHVISEVLVPPSMGVSLIKPVSALSAAAKVGKKTRAADSARIVDGIVFATSELARAYQDVRAQLKPCFHDADSPVHFVEAQRGANDYIREVALLRAGRHAETEMFAEAHAHPDELNAALHTLSHTFQTARFPFTAFMEDQQVQPLQVDETGRLREPAVPVTDRTMLARHFKNRTEALARYMVARVRGLPEMETRAFDDLDLASDQIVDYMIKWRLLANDAKTVRAAREVLTEANQLAVFRFNCCAGGRMPVVLPEVARFYANRDGGFIEAGKCESDNGDAAQKANTDELLNLLEKAYGDREVAAQEWQRQLASEAKMCETLVATGESPEWDNVRNEAVYGAYKSGELADLRLRRVSPSVVDLFDPDLYPEDLVPEVDPCEPQLEPDARDNECYDFGDSGQSRARTCKHTKTVVQKCQALKVVHVPCVITTPCQQARREPQCVTEIVDGANAALPAGAKEATEVEEDDPLCTREIVHIIYALKRQQRQESRGREPETKQQRQRRATSDAVVQLVSFVPLCSPDKKDEAVRRAKKDQRYRGFEILVETVEGKYSSAQRETITVPIEFDLSREEIAVSFPAGAYFDEARAVSALARWTRREAGFFGSFGGVRSSTTSIVGDKMLVLFQTNLDSSVDRKFITSSLPAGKVLLSNVYRRVMLSPIPAGKVALLSFKQPMLNDSIFGMFTDDNRQLQAAAAAFSELHDIQLDVDIVPAIGIATDDTVPGLLVKNAGKDKMTPLAVYYDSAQAEREAERLENRIGETNRYHSQLVLPLNIKNGDKAQKGRKALLDTGAVFGPDANDDSFDFTPLRTAFRDYVADSVRIKDRAKRVRVAEAVGGGLVAQLMQGNPDKVHVLSGIFTAMARDLFTAMERDNCVSPESLRLLEEINQFFVAASKTPVPARRAGEGTQQRNMSAMLRAAEVAEDAIEKSRLREAHSRSSKSLRNALAEEVVSGPWQGARSGLFVYVSRSANLYLDDNIRYPEHLFDALKGMLGAVARSVPMIETLEANFIVAEWDSAANYTNMLLRRLPSTSEVQQKQKAKAKKPKSPARAQQPPATRPQPQEQTPPQRQAQPQEQAQPRPPAQAAPVQVTPSASKSPVDQVTDISDIFLSALQK